MFSYLIFSIAFISLNTHKNDFFFYTSWVDVMSQKPGWRKLLGFVKGF